MIQDKIFFDEKDPTGLSYNTPFTFYGSYQGRLWSKAPGGEIKYYTQNSDLSAYATTGSNSFDGNQVITGSLTTTGEIVAQTLNVQQVTSSVVYSSGSNIFGNDVSNTQQFTGSVGVTGSLTVAGAGTFTGALNGTSASFTGVLTSTNVINSSTLPNIPSNHSITLYPPTTTNYYGGGIGWSEGTNTAASINVFDDGSDGALGLVISTGNNSNIAPRLTISSTGTIKGSNNFELTNAGGPYILVGEGTGADQYGAIDWDATNNRLRIATQPYAFGANGGQITLNTAGNVGIGTLTPDTNSRLDVNGQAFVARLAVYNNNGTPSLGTSPLLYSPASGTLAISTNTSERMRITSDGNVGIGIDNPSTPLDVYKTGSGGSSTGASLTLRSGNSSDTFGSQQILFSYEGGTLYRHSIRTRHMSDAAAGNSIDFFTWKYGTDATSDIGTQHVMTIDGNARVGIGTTTPGQTLELKSADGQGIRLKNAGSSDKNWDIVGSGNDLRINETGIGAVMAIKAGGYIGIGNTNPKFYLHSNDDVTIPNNRYLNFTSEINAANFNKSLVVSYTDSSATSQPNQIGLILHNNSNTDNTFSPALVFGSKSASNIYSQATAAIAGKRLTLQQDPNWHSGELYFWTATSGGASINQGIPADQPAMILDSRRRMRVPSQPSFQVHRGNAANFTISNTSDGTVLPFNVVRHDSAGNYNNSTYRFTAPIGGRYFFSATVRWDGSSSGSYLRTFFTVNGSSGQGGSAFNYGHAINGPSGYSSNYQSLTISAVIQLAEGDYVSVVGGINVGSTDMHAESQFSGYMLG